MHRYLYCYICRQTAEKHIWHRYLLFNCYIFCNYYSEMDFLDENNHVFNIWLAKRVGLYQMLDPGTARHRGKNVYHIAMTFIVLYLSVIAAMMNVSGIYYWKDNMPISIDYFWKAEAFLFVFYKMWIIVYRSIDIGTVCRSPGTVLRRSVTGTRVRWTVGESVRCGSRPRLPSCTCRRWSFT